MLLHITLIKQFYAKEIMMLTTSPKSNSLDEEVKTYLSIDAMDCEDEGKSFQLSFKSYLVPLRQQMTLQIHHN